MDLQSTLRAGVTTGTFIKTAHPQVVEVLAGPFAPREHGGALGRRQAVHGEAQRLAGGVGIDGADLMNHERKRGGDGWNAGSRAQSALFCQAFDADATMSTRG